MNPRNQHQLRTLMRRLPGAAATNQRHLAHCMQMMAAIERRFGIKNPRKVQLKHMLWYLDYGIGKSKSPTTKYDYWRSARAFAIARGRWTDWEHALATAAGARKGAGGRPYNGANRQTQPTTAS